MADIMTETLRSSPPNTTINTTTSIASSEGSPDHSKKRHSPTLSLDLSDLPPLSQPTPPSNTLLITNLNDPLIFTAPNLQAIRNAIDQQATLHAFSPLTALRRIICVFASAEAATALRQLLDGEVVSGSRVRVYFGEHTDLGDAKRDRHLAAPQPGKLFFISPPPSPPMGWESRLEDAPNREVHAEDLASALARIHGSHATRGAPDGPHAAAAVASQGVDLPPSPRSAGAAHGSRSRSSTIVFDPAHHDCSPDLPAIAVEDTTAEEPDELPDRDEPGSSSMQGPPEGDVEGGGRILCHTSRPPVELIEE